MNTEKRTNSSGSVSPGQKLSQGILLLINHVSRVRSGRLPRAILQDVREYDALCREYMGSPIFDKKVCEIGYGARPYRLATMISLGIDALGVDLDVPLLNFNRRTFLEIYRNNGFERLLKSLMRFVIADMFDNRQIRRMLASQGKDLQMPPERFLVGDAAEVIGDLDQVDLFISEDVFEHIPRPGLEKLVDKMADRLTPAGLAFVRPNIFTGITGGHRVEWFEDNIGKRWCQGISRPWGHLHDDWSVGDVYLNKLSRAEYRQLFERRFQILLERVKRPDLGASYLTGSVAGELNSYSQDELFSNQVLFVLKKK